MDYKELLERFADETPIVDGDVDGEMNVLRECLEKFFVDAMSDGIDRDTAIHIAASYVTRQIMETEHPVDKFFLYVYSVLRNLSEQINNQPKEA